MGAFYFFNSEVVMLFRQKGIFTSISRAAISSFFVMLLTGRLLEDCYLIYSQQLSLNVEQHRVLIVDNMNIYF